MATTVQVAEKAMEILASPLPVVRDGEALTADQWTILMALGDAVIGSIQPMSVNASSSYSVDNYETLRAQLAKDLPSGQDPKIVDEYLAENASSIPQIKEDLTRLFKEFLRPDAADGFRRILSVLNTRPGSLLLTGSTTLIQNQPVEVRQQILNSWMSSYLPPLRLVAKTFLSLFKANWIKHSEAFNKMIGFPRVPVHGTQGKGYDYQFLQFAPDKATSVETIETDVVIVGSGCGAGVCAKNIAESGLRVIVVEKGYWFPPEHLPMTQQAGAVHLFENNAAELSDDGSMVLSSGATFGGGGTVNWSASLQTQGYVRKEWADGGLPFFTSAEFQDCLDRVCDRMGVSAKHIEHNPTNKHLLEGARKLGLSCHAVPQNTGGKQHYCGYCTFGCGSAEKSGPVVSWLPDAAKAGAKFIEGYHAEKVLFDPKNPKRAIGVTGLWTSRGKKGGFSNGETYQRTVNIKAKRVIVSGGTFQSPLFLMRSGLKNPQIGRNLHLHPVIIVLAVMPEKTNPWEGGILTAAVDALEDLDGHGHGVKLEALTMMSAIAAPTIPWFNAVDWKIDAAKFNRMVGYISLSRDRDTGRVYPDPQDGKTRVAYSPSAFDRANIMEGVIALAKIAFIQGAEEIIHTVPGVPIYKRDPSEPSTVGINSPSLQAWLSLVRKRGLPDTATFGCAHQMGSCRMSAKRSVGVVDPKGKVWDTEGLYVADASVFPSASGVNPMISNMAISDYISRGLVHEMQGENLDRARL